MISSFWGHKATTLSLELPGRGGCRRAAPVLLGRVMVKLPSASPSIGLAVGTMETVGSVAADRAPPATSRSDSSSSEGFSVVDMALILKKMQVETSQVFVNAFPSSLSQIPLNPH